ncbi:MAG: UDP-N-acetylmuramoyl-L-alanine--D-glutamate ligase [Acidimicrobiales bacterium]
MTLDELCARRVAVWGLGREGLAVARLLGARGVTPLCIDDRPAAVGARPGGDADLRVVAPGSVDWTDLDVVVRSPGVSRYRPELETARARGVCVTTAMAVWFEDFAGAHVVAVTGTKGKSTTATLAASILRAEGLATELIGNIGVPVTDTYGRPPADAYVVEVSSYQAADVTVTPGVCVLTSLAPDHLDWHGSVETYYRDKLHLIEAGPPGALGVNAGSDEAVRRTGGHPDRTLFGPEGRVRVGQDRVVTVDGTPLADASGLRVPGVHNLWNLCGAVTGALLLRGRPPSDRAVAAAIDGFDGLPSRCHTLGDRHSRTFVDDALASNPYAAAASVRAFPGRELTVILGGADRGVDATELVEALASRTPTPRVVVLTPDPAGLADALTVPAGSRPATDGVTVQTAPDLAGAVAAALAVTPAGGVVLFSPGAPTPEGGGGFGERSRQFAAAAGFAGPGADAGTD